MIRRKTFGPKDDFKTFKEAQEYLLGKVMELNKKVPYGAVKSPYDRLQEERKGLFNHPGRMECFTAENYKVDKYATICVGTNRYSVPDKLVGRMVFVKSYSSYIRISYNNEELCQHSRSYERFIWQIDLNHYLTTLHRKPGAIAGSVALRQAPSWISSLYSEHFIHNPRSFVELLQYCQTNDIAHSQLRNTIATLVNRYPNSVDTDHVIALLGNQPEESPVAKESVAFDAIAIQSMENLGELASMMN